MRNELHLTRKLWHMVMGLAIITIYLMGIPQDMALTILGGLFVWSVSMEILRLRNPVLNEKCIKFFGAVIRSHEVNRVSGMPYYIASSIIAIAVLGWYYLRVPSLVGIGQYKLYAELPRSGGLYATANVTYRGAQIGKVTAVEPTERGARATMSVDDRYKIPADATANVHSVSAIGEQYLDLVSTGNPSQYLKDGQTITGGTVPSEVGPALDAANRGLAVLPKEKIDSLLTETSKAVGGLGPALQRLVDGTTNLAQDFRENLPPVNDVVAQVAPFAEAYWTDHALTSTGAAPGL